MLNSNATIAEIKNIQSLVKNVDAPAIYSCVGENGMFCTRHLLHVCEGLNCLVNPEVKMFNSECEARKFSYTRYLERFFERNNNFSIVSICPRDFPAEYIWLDVNYEARNEVS